MESAYDVGARLSNTWLRTLIVGSAITRRASIEISQNGTPLSFARGKEVGPAQKQFATIGGLHAGSYMELGSEASYDPRLLRILSLDDRRDLAFTEARI